MPGHPDPSDVDVSGRGETQPSSGEATERFAEQTERSETHNEAAKDPTALYGPAEHDESSEATVGKGPGSGETKTTQTDEANEDADEHSPNPGQPHPS